MKKERFDRALCVTSGDGFEEGYIYPSIGWNNGIHVLRENETGDIVDRVFCCGGVGKGDLNPFDNSGKPSFELLVR